MSPGVWLLNLEEGLQVGLNLKFSLVTDSKVVRKISVSDQLAPGQHLPTSLLWSHLENSPALQSVMKASQLGPVPQEELDRAWLASQIPLPAVDRGIPYKSVFMNLTAYPISSQPPGRKIHFNFFS